MKKLQRICVGALAWLCLCGFRSWDVSQVCTEATKDAFTRGMVVFNSNPALFDTGTTEEILAQIGGSRPPNYYPWILLNHPRIEVQKAGYLSMLESLKLVTGRSRNADLKSYFASHASNPTTYSQSYVDGIKGTIQWLISGGSTFGTDLQFLKDNAPFLCATYLVPGCTEGFVKILDLMSPRAYGNSNYSMLPVLQEVLTEPAYVRGASIAALKIMGRIDSRSRRPRARGDEGHLLRDLVDSYLEAGLPLQEATDRAWNVLAIYSSRGANIFSAIADFRRDEDVPVISALSVIAAGMGYLNGLTLASTHPYAYPAGLQTTCHHGRSYHFWMAAFFSRWLVSQGFSPAASETASHLSGMMYEMGSSTTGRDPLLPFFADLYHPYSNSIRANLVFNDAGARYGAMHEASVGGDLPHSVDLDAGMIRLLDHAHALPPKDPQALRQELQDPKIRYAYWRVLFAPDVNLPEFWMRTKPHARRAHP